MNGTQNGKTLIAYYSMSGHTRALAEEIRRTLGADIDEIREPRERQGFSGVMSALFDALRRREPPIEPPVRDPANYDLLILGGPIWAGRLASPVRTYTRGASATEVYAFTRPGDLETQTFARSIGACWAGDSDSQPPCPLDAAIPIRSRPARSMPRFCSRQPANLCRWRWPPYARAVVWCAPEST